MMALIGFCLSKPGPADQAARPITLPDMRSIDEITELHRGRALPSPVFVAIFGNAGAGADTGAGQHEQTRIGAEEILELLDWHGRAHA